MGLILSTLCFFGGAVGGGVLPSGVESLNLITSQTTHTLLENSQLTCLSLECVDDSSKCLLMGAAGFTTSPCLPPGGLRQFWLCSHGGDGVFVFLRRLINF